MYKMRDGRGRVGWGGVAGGGSEQSGEREKGFDKLTPLQRQCQVTFLRFRVTLDHWREMLSVLIFIALRILTISL
jgi:hypothetical protein